MNKLMSNPYVIYAACFVAGMIFQCILCKLFKPCCKKSTKPVSKPTFNKGSEKPFEKRKPHPAPADGSTELYVGNLSYDMTEEQLKAMLSEFGTVSQCRLVINKYNGKSKGFGFVQMPSRAEAEKACAALNDKEMNGRKIKCNEAKNLI